jgi:chromatin structure-remodeling complex subunit RSC3/30
MLLDPSLVQEKILCLEENGGWNDEGTIRKGAWARISLFKSILREKVLELSLSYRVEDIRRKVEWVLFFLTLPLSSDCL